MSLAATASPASAAAAPPPATTSRRVGHRDGTGPGGEGGCGSYRRVIGGTSRPLLPAGVDWIDAVMARSLACSKVNSLTGPSPMARSRAAAFIAE
jgi:hypothetical protein